MDIVSYTEFLVKSIVKEPEMVKVESFAADEDTEILEIIVHNSDMGTVIGQNGRTAGAIRTLVQAFAYLKKLNRVKINIDSF